MAGYVPSTTGSALRLEAWQKTIEGAVYEAAKAYPVAVARDRLYKKLHIRKLSNFSARTYADTGVGNADLTYDSNTEVEVTLTPSARYFATSFSLNQFAQMDQDPTNPFKSNLEDLMGAAIDVDFLTNGASLTTNVLGNGARTFDKAFMLGGMAQLRSSCKGVFEPGDPGYLHFTPLQWDDIMSIPEISSANLRGDNANPNARGVLHEGWGLRLVVTGNVYVDGSAVAHNVLWHPSAIGISFNQKIKVFTQEYELSERLYVYANYGTSIVWDERAVDMRTTSAA